MKTETQEGTSRSRMLVIDVSRHVKQNHSNNRPPARFEPRRPQPEPVRRVDPAMGAFRAATALQDIADRIRALGVPSEVMLKIITDAEARAAELHSMLTTVVYDSRR